jgi:UDP-N-acetylglucosamine 2-epimerase (non-hydrolysing)
LPLIDLGCAGLPDPNVHAGKVARQIAPLLKTAQLVAVQGDTSSALGGALGGSLAGVPVAHVEAGLRSHDPMNPCPEEGFRIAIDRLAALLFAPTELSAANLRREEIQGLVQVTGNTGIDALLERIPFLRPPVRSKGGTCRLLATCHRRESWGDGFRAIASCLKWVALRPDVAISLVLHPNPRIAEDVRSFIGSAPITLLEPCGHSEMLEHMRGSDLILSDSGGMQEEAPALGIPLLILRDRTERPECIASGNAILVGRSAREIERVICRLLDDPGSLSRMRRPSFAFGDGRASHRIAATIEAWLQRDLMSAELLSPSSLSAKAPAAR